MLDTLRERTDDSTPLLLDRAAQIAFPDGSMTGRKLAHAARAGTLAVEIICGKKYTTLAYIKAMRERSRVNARGQRDIPATPSSSVAVEQARRTAARLKADNVGRK
jgi:hypothetical protein